MRSRVSISIPTLGQVKIEAELPAPGRSWSFRNAYAAALGIAERVEDFRATQASGQDARVRKSAVGEFRSDLDATRITYIVKLSEPPRAYVPHVSWLAGDRGFMMLADLIPTDIESVSVEFILPSGWTVESSIGAEADGRYQVMEPEKSVFFVGRSLRRTSKNMDGMVLETVVDGAWSFKDSDVITSASRVAEKYLALTGFKLPGNSVVMIAAAPVSLGASTWVAETRGSSVMVLIDPGARSKKWVAQLDIIFSHEILHLWVPNALRLEGDYDWFFEGFTLYMALRTALELKDIKFDGFLDTLARVYDSYTAQGDNLSLTEGSQRRWTSVGTNVYVKGMLVAFLYDLMVRKQSEGRTTLATRYRDLFNGGVADHAEGNEAIIKWLAAVPSIGDFTKSYIESSGVIKLEQVLPVYGFQVEVDGKGSRLRIARELTDEQKRLLQSLMYRN